jgi:hypothetical protein
MKRLVSQGGNCSAPLSVGRIIGHHLQINPVGERSWVMRATDGILRRDIEVGGCRGLPSPLTKCVMRSRRPERQVVEGNASE